MCCFYYYNNSMRIKCWSYYMRYSKIYQKVSINICIISYKKLEIKIEIRIFLIKILLLKLNKS